MFANKHIKEYQVLVENEEYIPDHKHIRDFLKRIAASDMRVIKAVIAAVQGSTFPTLETFVTLLGHFVSQTKSGRGIASADRCGRGCKHRGRFGHGGGGGCGNSGGHGGRVCSGGGGKPSMTTRNYNSYECSELLNYQMEKVGGLHTKKSGEA